MPQTTPERRSRWPGGDSEAIEFLRQNGYSLRRDWCCWYWKGPDREPTTREKDAIIYLIEEWDFGDLIT